MFRTTTFAALMALATLGAAQAAPRLENVNGDQQVVYDEPSQNIVGGGAATLTGEANNRQVVYGGMTIAQIENGQVPQLVGGGQDFQIVYTPAPASAGTVAAR